MLRRLRVQLRLLSIDFHYLLINHVDRVAIVAIVVVVCVLGSGGVYLWQGAHFVLYVHVKADSLLIDWLLLVVIYAVVNGVNGAKIALLPLIVLIVYILALLLQFRYNRSSALHFNIIIIILIYNRN